MSSMVPIAQEELFEAPPTRRIIVPKGHTAWYGVDPSTTRVSIAWCGVDALGEVSRGVATRPFPPSEGPARLSDIYEQTRRFVMDMLTPGSCEWAPRWPLPGVVLIEQPSGKMENPNLSYAVGVIQAAVYDGLLVELGCPVRIETVTSSHWKKVACGAGNIYKPKTRHGHYGVLAWAQRNGYTGTSWDEADAMGIAECARREIGLEER